MLCDGICCLLPTCAALLTLLRSLCASLGMALIAPCFFSCVICWGQSSLDWCDLTSCALAALRPIPNPAAKRAVSNFDIDLSPLRLLRGRQEQRPAPSHSHSSQNYI